jgi:hypothetical protein
MSSSVPTSSLESLNKRPRGDSRRIESHRPSLEMAPECVSNVNLDDPARQMSNTLNDNNSSSQPDDDGNSTDALAEAFSYSLAHIAASHRAAAITNSDESHEATERYPVHKTSASQSSGGDSDEMDVVHRHYPCHALMETHESSSDARPRFHRHHKRACVEALPSDTDGVFEASDIPFRSAAPTVVVAPLALPSLRRLSTATEGIASLPGSTSSLNEDGAGDVLSSSLLAHPYRREPCFHTIRQTFHMVGSKRSSKPTRLVDVMKAPSHNGDTRGLKRKTVTKLDVPAQLPQPLVHNRSNEGVNECEDYSEMDSGSDGGYSASYSSNGSGAAGKYDFSSCSSDEESTDDNYDKGRNKPVRESGDPLRPMLSEKKQECSPLSSDIADFSSSFSVHASKARSDSPSFTSSSSHLGDEEEHSVQKNEVIRTKARGRSRRVAPVWTLMPHPPSPTARTIADSDQCRYHKRSRLIDRKPAAVHRAKTLDGKIPILALGCDVMAHVLTFLEPPEVLDVLTMPLSKGWLLTFTRQPELWRVLCLLEPFKAQVTNDDDSVSSCYSSSSDEDSDFALSLSTGKSSKFRLQYASYVRCMRCLDRIKEDAVSGRPLSVVDYAAVLKESTTASTTVQNFGANQNLQQFLAQARGYATTTKAACRTPVVDATLPPTTSTSLGVARRPSDKPKLKIKSLKTLQAHQGLIAASAVSKEKKVTFGHSKLTQRLLGPTLTGTLSEVELPWTYGIYSIVNWMMAYSDVEGIQTMCLRVLPFLLENEQQRITAQRAGLTDIVLRDMVLFPKSVILHTAAFHTIVLLARPLGGQEGMLFHTSMVNSSGIFGSTAEGSVGGKSGIAVLIDSMRRFELNESLQSMACWSLVNIALAPSQKEVLVKLGGIDVIAHAMKEHQYSADVQFRALFALINLVIPSVTSAITNNTDENLDDDLGIDTTEKEMLDELVDQIIGLVVLAMKNYCSHEAILNRACLVLHNLSLSPCYHASMLWTPNCYQMLEWCLSNYRTDQVLQQSAAGTLHRLQTTLSSDEALRLRFVTKLQTQQVDSMERANQDVPSLQGQP